MKSGIASSYRDQRRIAGQSLARVQNADGGWGLSLKGASSIVNTAEALNVIRASGLGDSPSAERAASYIPQALRQHYGRLTDKVSSVRGGNVRYLTFGLEGLVTVPKYSFEKSGIQGINFCINAIKSAQSAQGGVLADIDVEAPSYHQTARALISVSKLLATEGAAGALSSATWRRAVEIANDAATFLIEEQGDLGAWKVAPLRRSPLDPAKTAIAMTALSYYRAAHDSDDLRERLRRASSWLLSVYPSWSDSLSSDDQEAGSDWRHLNYAECPRAIASVDTNATDVLNSSWSFMVRLWKEPRNRDENGLWTEPGANVTIRAAYHTVMAFETVLGDSLVIVPTPIESRAISASASTDGNGRYRVWTDAAEWRFDISEAEAQDALLREIVEAGGSISLRDLSAKLGKSTNVLSEYKKRVNDNVRKLTAGGVPELIETVGRSVYRFTRRPDDE